MPNLFRWTDVDWSSCKQLEQLVNKSWIARPIYKTPNGLTVQSTYEKSNNTPEKATAET